MTERETVAQRRYREQQLIGARNWFIGLCCVVVALSIVAFAVAAWLEGRI